LGRSSRDVREELIIYIYFDLSPVFSWFAPQAKGALEEKSKKKLHKEKNGLNIA
jgi:hypothetical protein